MKRFLLTLFVLFLSLPVLAQNTGLIVEESSNKGLYVFVAVIVVALIGVAVFLKRWKRKSSGSKSGAGGSGSGGSGSDRWIGGGTAQS